MRINDITNVPKVAGFHQQWLIFDRNMDFSIFYPSYLVKTVVKPSDIQGLAPPQAVFLLQLKNGCR